jgi:hypothetical protein
MFEAESHSRVRGLNPALVAVFALAVAGLMLVPALPAQINGTPASVTSLGFGGNPNPAPGVRPSVTSLGRNGFNGTPAFPNCCINPLFPLNPNPPRSGHNHRRDHDFRRAGGAVYGAPYPVVVDPGVDTSADEEEYRGGPTIFDRRGPGTPLRFSDPYEARADAVSAHHTDASAPAGPVEDQPQTTLVFKDGQRLDVENYAIVGSTLYDLTPGHRRKVALAELDLAATAKENDDRGINFQLPPSLSMNSAN